MRWIALAALLVAGQAFGHGLWWNRVTHFESSVEIKPSDGAITYRIEWADDGAAFGADRTRTVTAASVTMPDQPPGVRRCYRVVAIVGTFPESDPSEQWCRGDVPLPVRPKPRVVVGLSGN